MVLSTKSCLLINFDQVQAGFGERQSLSYEEAESFLLKLGFKMRSPGSSHFIFWKEGYEKNISLKKRSQLLPYQIRMLEEVVKNYEQNEKNEEQ